MRRKVRLGRSVDGSAVGDVGKGGKICGVSIGVLGLCKMRYTLVRAR